MRFFLLIFVLLAIDGYAFVAMRTVFNTWPAYARYLFYSLYWAIPIITLLFLTTGLDDRIQNWNKNALVYLRTFLFIAYASKLLIIPIILIDDVRRLATLAFQHFNQAKDYDPSRSRFITQIGLFLGSVPFVTLLYGMIRNPYRYKVFREKVNLPRLPASLAGLRIVQISDIHSGSFTFREPVKDAIRLINEQKPDLVFFTGDLVNNQSDEMDRFMDIFDKIEARYGVYSVLGNHDYGDYVRWPNAAEKEKNLDKLKSIHRQLGWNLLNNENRILQINDQPVAVMGVENYSAHPRFPKYGKLAEAYQGTEGAVLKLLLSHDPSHWQEQVVTDYQDIDFTFSGHTHGFQFGIEIPGWLKWSPAKYIYKQWAGLYQAEQQYLYVNRGLGFLGYPGRVGILPEITVIDLNTVS